jgi:dienelactone hydrolase
MHANRLPAIFLSLALTICLLPSPIGAQQHLQVARSDGRSTPLLLYRAAGSLSSCASLAVISHGAGGSENGYRYLAQAMANLGYTTVVMGHAESGLAALATDMRQYGPMQGVTHLVADPTAEKDRLLDVAAALRWADTQCRAPFRVLLGHSMGAETVMLEAGAKNMIGVASPPAGQNRFDAYVALSPEGSGVVFPDDAWRDIRKPVLILTGTRDQSLKGGPQARLEPWRNLPGIASHCQWQGVIDGVTHMNFAGTGIGHDEVEPLVTQTIAAFLAGVRAGRCTLPAPANEMNLQAK